MTPENRTRRGSSTALVGLSMLLELAMLTLGLAKIVQAGFAAAVPYWCAAIYLRVSRSLRP